MHHIAQLRYLRDFRVFPSIEQRAFCTDPKQYDVAIRYLRLALKRMETPDFKMKVGDLLEKLLERQAEAKKILYKHGGKG
jgi:hypothetical protein